MKLAKKIVVGIITSFLVYQSVGVQTGSAATYEEYPVSSGVKYKENREVINGYDQSIKVLEVNLQDQYTKLDLSVLKIGTLSGTTAQAKYVHTDENRVVGAVNGSFFDTKTRLPMYLIAQNDTLINSGIIASTRDQYVNEPIAFGINASKKAQIDYYDLDLTATHNGTNVEITSINKVRTENNLILYTPEYMDGYTNSNQYGMEVIFTGATKNKDLKFGDKITGTVSEIRPYNTVTNIKIPADGFVLSAHGTENLQFVNEMKVGDQVEVSINIDDKWKGAQYILASGPRLVDNGNVSLSIDPNSQRALERAPRTAIAVDRTLTKVFMVTVDGRAEGYSKGMNLTEFAQYLVKLGAYKAINLDGGGSTTMMARRYGNDMASLINKPSDGWERAVHTSLQAVSTAPTGTASMFDVGLSSSTVTVGDSITVSLKYVLDQFYNPIANDPSKLKLSSLLGTFDGATLKTTTPGEGVIVATYGNLTKEIPIKVTNEKSPFSDVQSTNKYYPQIKYLYDHEIIAGYPDGTYRPASTLKRLDAALLLVRALKLDTTTVQDIDFLDVPKEYRFYKEIAAIANAGIINGKESGTVFDPNSPLTRAEMAAILQRAFMLQASGEMPFTDVPKESFAYNDILSLYANGITKGYGIEYRPNGTVDRVQYALFLHRAVTMQ